MSTSSKVPFPIDDFSSITPVEATHRMNQLLFACCTEGDLSTIAFMVSKGVICTTPNEEGKYSWEISSPESPVTKLVAQCALAELVISKGLDTDLQLRLMGACLKHLAQVNKTVNEVMAELGVVPVE